MFVNNYRQKTLINLCIMWIILWISGVILKKLSNITKYYKSRKSYNSVILQERTNFSFVRQNSNFFIVNNFFSTPVNKIMKKDFFNILYK